MQEWNPKELNDRRGKCEMKFLFVYIFFQLNFTLFNISVGSKVRAKISKHCVHMESTRKKWGKKASLMWERWMSECNRKWDEFPFASFFQQSNSAHTTDAPSYYASGTFLFAHIEAITLRHPFIHSSFHLQTYIIFTEILTPTWK